MTPPSEALRLYGTEEPVSVPRRVQAGRLRCDFDAGSVSGLWWGEVELLRGIAYLLRDENWGTAASLVDMLEVELSSIIFCCYLLVSAIAHAVLKKKEW